LGTVILPGLSFIVLATILAAVPFIDHPYSD
jgi:hypothetical protein